MQATRQSLRLWLWLAGWLPIFSLLFPSVSQAGVDPAEVGLIFNAKEPASRKLAEYYAKARNVPISNLIAVETTTEDEISRADYESQIVTPVKKFLFAQQNQPKKIRVLCTFFGVPLRVQPPEPMPEIKQQMEKLRLEVARMELQLAPLRQLLQTLPKDGDINKAKREDTQKKIAALEAERTQLEQRNHALGLPEAAACVDSELMLVLWPTYEKNRFVFNPLHWQTPPEKARLASPVLMTSRIDGPSPDHARDIIDKAIATEKTGLKGKVYVDARGLTNPPKGDPGWGLHGYDDSMKEMAGLLKNVGKMDVTLDEKEALFPVGSCKDTALYCGWYSVGNFVDCCEFAPGAIAWHLASYEALTLHKESKGWCRNLLLKGATVTLGPVAEPYTVGFPKPEEFFGFLATGEYTLVECYARTTVLTSWMMVLVGDPLYNPYQKTPKLPVSAVKPSPAWGKMLNSEN